MNRAELAYKTSQMIVPSLTHEQLVVKLITNSMDMEHRAIATGNEELIAGAEQMLINLTNRYTPHHFWVRVEPEIGCLKCGTVLSNFTTPCKGVTNA